MNLILSTKTGDQLTWRFKKKKNLITNTYKMEECEYKKTNTIILNKNTKKYYVTIIKNQHF